MHVPNHLPDDIKLINRKITFTITNIITIIQLFRVMYPAIRFDILKYKNIFNASSILIAT